MINKNIYRDILVSNNLRGIKMKRILEKAIFVVLEQFIKLILPVTHSKALNITPNEANKVISKIYKPKRMFGDKENYISFINKLRADEIDLSIIIPVYNSEKYLEKCLDSRSRTKNKILFEIITVNDLLQIHRMKY